MNTQQSSQTEPDPDAIKMFVGQIPRAMDENDLKKMFEEYGPVFQLNVLRDKVTGQSKGCCFVTFYTRKAALDAQNELHNMKTMPGMHHPIQMKPADSEKRNEERKLFVGMISKKLNENDIRMMFSGFGSIEDCTVLRDQNGQSRGCAFVTFANRQSAQSAIKSMHHSTTMEGCSSPLVVKFADTQKEKEAKKMQQMTANLWNMSLGPLGALAPQYLAAAQPNTVIYHQLLQQAASSGNMGAFNNLQNMGAGQNMGGQNMGNLGNLGGMGLQQLMAAAAASSNNPGLLAALASATLNSNQSSLGASNGSMNSGAGANPSGASGGKHAHMGGSESAQRKFSMMGFGGARRDSAAKSLAGNNWGDQQNNVQMQNLQGIAALASLANNPATLNALGVQNVSALNQLVQAAVSSSQGNQQGGSNNPLSQLANLQNLTSNNMSGMGGLNSNSMNGLGSSGNTSGMDALSQAYSGIQSYAASFPNAFNTGSQLQQSANSAAGKQTEGPDGANLFIYHLPQEFGDQDLMQMFMPFGNVVSAKVFIDKQTNLSKCFGFVSYDNPVSAQAAIQAMNGFQIGMKRLKVQLKRPKNDSKPY